MTIPRDKLLHLALGVIAMLCALPVGADNDNGGYSIFYYLQC